MRYTWGNFINQYTLCYMYMSAMQGNVQLTREGQTYMFAKLTSVGNMWCHFITVNRGRLLKVGHSVAARMAQPLMPKL